MIYKLKIFSVLLLFIGIQTGVSQEVASNYSKEIQLNKFRMFEKAEATGTAKKEVVITNTVLTEGTYTFDNGKKEVLVEIKNGYYTEHYANNEFIKAKINWVSKQEYNLVITEINKKGIPFGEGTILNTKISKVKGNRFYYESNLEGLTWSGRFIKQ